MRYYYGTNNSYSPSKGRTVSVPQLASIIKRDVECGKWNNYHGGTENNSTASCSYSKKGFIFHSRLFINGKKEEFQRLETLIQDFIEVIPRKFN